MISENNEKHIELIKNRVFMDSFFLCFYVLRHKKNSLIKKIFQKKN